MIPVSRVLVRFAALLCLSLSACSAIKPQRGGGATASLGGASAPTVVTSRAPENPSTPTTTTVEKAITRDYSAPVASRSDTHAAGLQNPTGHVTGAEAALSAPTATGAPLPPALLRETVTERATTTTGAAQKDTARDLGVRLTNLRGVLWVGVALLIGGPLIGWKLGWFTNGCIAGAVGLLLIILSTVIPGHEAWFGLFGLGAIPLVAFIYYRAHHDATAKPTP